MYVARLKAGVKLLQEDVTFLRLCQAGITSQLAQECAYSNFGLVQRRKDHTQNLSEPSEAQLKTLQEGTPRPEVPSLVVTFEVAQ